MMCASGLRSGFAFSTRPRAGGAAGCVADRGTDTTDMVSAIEKRSITPVEIADYILTVDPPSR